MQHLPFWFLVAWKRRWFSEERAYVVFSDNRGRASWHCLFCHMVVVTVASLSPQGFHPVVSCALSVLHSVSPEFVVKVAGTQGKACSPFHFNRGRLEKIPLECCPVWRYKTEQEKAVVTFHFFNSCSIACGLDRLRNTRLKCTVVLVNSVILTKRSFLKNHVNWFIVSGCVMLNGVLSCREADTHSSAKLALSFTLPPAFSERKKKSTHEFGPEFT